MVYTHRPVHNPWHQQRIFESLDDPVATSTQTALEGSIDKATRRAGTAPRAGPITGRPSRPARIAKRAHRQADQQISRPAINPIARQRMLTT
jgi:hypothetical protein